MNSLDLGRCCSCEKDGSDVRNIISLHYRAPEAGKGWGCFVCGLPSDGAVAVLCDDCMDPDYGFLRFVCAGYPFENRRVSLGDVVGKGFNHNMDYHMDDDRE